jgi:hypothetical protein
MGGGGDLKEDTPFGVTDLEEQLVGAEGETRQRELLERFAALDADAQREINAGVTPARFRALTEIRAALAAARRIVLMYNIKRS